VGNLSIAIKLLWKPFDQQFGTVMDDFREHRKNVEKEAALSHMVEAKEARDIERLNRKGLLRKLCLAIKGFNTDAWQRAIEFDCCHCYRLSGMKRSIGNCVECGIGRRGLG
jgi:hypothetical protein